MAASCALCELYEILSRAFGPRSVQAVEVELEAFARDLLAATRADRKLGRGEFGLDNLDGLNLCGHQLAHAGNGSSGRGGYRSKSSSESMPCWVLYASCASSVTSSIEIAMPLPR